jgi:hypothetical protein
MTALVFLVTAWSPAVSYPGAIRSLNKLETKLLSREVMERSRNLADSTRALEDQLDTFGYLLDLSEKSQLRRAMRELELVEELQRKQDADAAVLAAYLEANERRLGEEGSEHLVRLAELSGKNFRRFSEALHDYLAARRELLVWTEENFKPLANGDEDARRHFEELFKRCQKRMEKQYDRYLERVEFIRNFINKHPELAEYAAR